MGEPVTLWRYKCGATAVEFDSSPLWPDDEEYKALPAAEFAALTAERDALAALLKEARDMLNATSVFNNPQLPDERERLDLLARIDAAGGRPA